MSRLILAIPATAAAAAAAAAASATAYRAPSTSGKKTTLERRSALAVAHPELLQVAPSIHETNGTGADAARVQVLTRAPEGSVGEEAVAPSIKRRMPARFQLEDEDDSMQSLYNSRPPIGDATLRSGLGVEITTW